jgi:hypothetical protein
MPASGSATAMSFAVPSASRRSLARSVGFTAALCRHRNRDSGHRGCRGWRRGRRLRPGRAGMCETAEQRKRDDELCRSLLLIGRRQHARIPTRLTTMPASTMIIRVGVLSVTPGC